jgi:hypothetical protein
MEPTMGTLLQFSPRRRAAGAGLPVLRGPADILLFTGVRYERAEVAARERAIEGRDPPDRRVQPS